MEKSERSNIEIKARTSTPEKLRRLTEAIGGVPTGVMHQKDTFFIVPSGRLKLREVEGRPGELIYYDRGDSPGPKLSRYMIAAIEDAETLKSIFAEVLDVRGVVTKHRTLYMLGQTRIHLDEVEGLGHFVELEVVLDPDESAEDGFRIARDVMRRLEIDEHDLVDRAYIDLLQSSAAVGY